MISFITSIDWNVLTSLYAMRDPQLVQVAIWISELGEWYTVCGLAAWLGLVLALRRHPIYFMGLFIAVSTSGIATFLLKSIVARPRPPLEFQAYQEVWYSFPSAHAAMSLAFYGFVAYLVWRMNKSRFFRFATLAFTALLVLVIGSCRLYLGVHYLSDVVGGYVLGALCLWLSIWTVRAYTNA